MWWVFQQGLQRCFGGANDLRVGLREAVQELHQVLDGLLLLLLWIGHG